MPSPPPPPVHPQHARPSRALSLALALTALALLSPTSTAAASSAPGAVVDGRPGSGPPLPAAIPLLAAGAGAGRRSLGPAHAGEDETSAVPFWSSSSSSSSSSSPASAAIGSEAHASDGLRASGRARSSSAAAGTKEGRKGRHRRLARAEVKRQEVGEESTTTAAATAEEGEGEDESAASATVTATVDADASATATATLLASLTSSSSLSTADADAASATPSTSSSSASGKAIPLAFADLPVPDPFPQAFDVTLSLNFTTACLTFLSALLTAPTFAACRPLSFLIPTSSAFATLTKAASLDGLSAAVAASLDTAVEADACAQWMEAKGGEMAGACRRDLAEGNAVARQALNGFETFAVVRSASALTDPASEGFCYVAAVGAQEADDVYLWSLFTGQAYPSSATPTCSNCSRALLAAYASSGTAANGSLALSAVYGPAAERVNGVCGDGWAEEVVVVQGSSGASTRARVGGAGTAVVAVGVGLVALGFGWA